MSSRLLKPTTVLLALAAVFFVASTVKSVQAEETRPGHKDTNSTDAYDAFLEGWTRYRQNTPEDFAEAIPYFKRAIELDPNYGRPHAALALVYVESWRK